MYTFMPRVMLQKPSKRLVIFCDGTWVGRETKVAGAPRSNIRMLADMVGDLEDSNMDIQEDPAVVHRIKSRSADVVAGYQEGVGLGATFFEYLWNGATASAISEECVSVYRFIVENYTDDHEIWLFGFSRGAFTVRCVAGMINNCGIIRRQKGKLDSQEVDRLCYEVFRTYRSSLPIDAPQSDQCKRRRADANNIWQVEQPIRCMSIIDTVGALGIPRLNAGIGFDWAPFEFFDQYVSTTVQHVRHAPALHDRLWAFQPCLVFPSQKAPNTVVEQVWFPGVHYDLGRQTFRFIRQHPSNKIEEALGWLPNLLSRTIWPNEVLADNVLRWMLVGVRDVNEGGTSIILDLEDKISEISARIETPLKDSTGSGDVYGNLLEFVPAGGVFGTLQVLSSSVNTLLNNLFPKLGVNIQNVLGIRAIIEILKATVDRRIPGVAADVDVYKNIVASGKGVLFSVEGNARMKEWNEWKMERYPSRTFENHELWTRFIDGYENKGDVAVSSAMDVLKDVSQDYDPPTSSKDHDPPVQKSCGCEPLERNLLSDSNMSSLSDQVYIQERLPETWRWDVQYETLLKCWTCTPDDPNEPISIPFTIADSPVIIPVEYRWPPIGGLNPPPDPRLSAPIDSRTEIAMDDIIDIFVTFKGSIGFYILINGLLQVIVPKDFDAAWASLHLPHRFGGLKVSYIEQTLELTALATRAARVDEELPPGSEETGLSSSSRLSQSAPAVAASTRVELNDLIEARRRRLHRERFIGRIGLRVSKEGSEYLIMSSHVITEAILARAFYGMGGIHKERLRNDWNMHTDIWAGNEKIGVIEKTFDTEANIYPNGFKYDCTLIKPTNKASIQGVKSPIAGLGWLDQAGWSTLRQRTSHIKILGPTETSRDAKTMKCRLCSDVLTVGEGIFLNQTAAAGANYLRNRDMSTWISMVSRAILYRVNPDFDPPNGYSGIALYAQGTREDGTEGPGVVGFQSFVQRSGQVQDFNMEGLPLEQRLKRGRIAFYGAFQVPDELREDYTIA